MRTTVLVCMSLASIACAAPATDDDVESTDANVESSSDDEGDDESDERDDTTTTDADLESSTGTSTGGDPEGPAACDPWAQDCPADEKCMPYEMAPVDMLVWDALGCFPLAATPKEPGDACTVVGNGVSGMDDCAMGAMCMGVDEETLVGVCIAMCEGTAAAPGCADPSTTCIIANDGVILVCLPQCDPLVQDCAEGEGCYESGTGGFFCFAQDETAGEAGYAAPCGTLNYCDPGLMCAAAEMVPDCDSDYCCTEFCDAAEGPEQCSGAAQGQTCTPYFAADAAPPGFDDVGVCAVPQ